jgi:hypothetical protein
MINAVRRNAAIGLLLLGLGTGAVGGYKYGRWRLRAQLAAISVAPAAMSIPSAASAGSDATPVESGVPTAHQTFQAKEGGTVAAETRTEDLKLFLPNPLYATPGVELSVYFDNLVDVKDSGRFQFRVSSAFGSSYRRRWAGTPTEAHVGKHPFELQVLDLRGKPVASAKTELIVTTPKAGEGRSVRVLYVGDSLTHPGHHPAELKRLAAKRGYPNVSFLGTHSYQDNPGILHEGYSGWTWHCFLNHYEPGSAKTRYRDHSPFLYREGKSSPKLDVDRYLREHSPGGPPDLVVFQLGINDVYCQPQDYILKNADTLVGAFRKAAPAASLAVWLTQPVNYTQASFDFAYDAKIKRTDIKSRQHELAQAFARKFGGREREGLFVIPMNVSLDVVEDYPANDAVHPTVSGYQRLGQTLYAWMNYWLDQNEWKPTARIARK